MTRGRKRRPDPRTRVVDGFPTRAPSGRAVLYAIGFETGVVKFGKSFRPRARLRRICCTNEAAAVWVHVFGPIKPASGQGKQAFAEAEAIRLALMHGRRASPGHSCEYIVGLTKQQALQCGRAARSLEQAA